LEQELQLQSLGVRRKVADVVMLFKILRGVVDCPALLAEINLRIPSRTRSQDLFCRQHYSTLYDYHSPLARVVRQANLVAREVDFFFDNLGVLRRLCFDVLK